MTTSTPSRTTPATVMVTPSRRGKGLRPVVEPDHFLERLEERYGVRLSADDLALLEARVMRADPLWVRFLHYGAGSRHIYAILLGPGQGAKVVYDPELQRLVTALPPPGHPDYVTPRFYRKEPN